MSAGTWSDTEWKAPEPVHLEERIQAASTRLSRAIDAAMLEPSALLVAAVRGRWDKLDELLTLQALPQERRQAVVHRTAPHQPPRSSCWTWGYACDRCVIDLQPHERHGGRCIYCGSVARKYKETLLGARPGGRRKPEPLARGA